MPVAVVCGGHNAGNAATRAGAGALVLDLGGMDGVSVDEAANEVTVGGGAKMRQLVEAVAAAGRSLPVGTGATISVAGYVDTYSVAIPLTLVGLTLIMELPWLMGSFCTSKMVEHPKTQLAKPGCMSRIAILYM